MSRAEGWVDRADRYLVECLGVSSYQRCLNAINLIGSGQSPASAYEYQAVVAQYRFMCGAAYFRTRPPLPSPLSLPNVRAPSSLLAELRLLQARLHHEEIHPGLLHGRLPAAGRSPTLRRLPVTHSNAAPSSLPHSPSPLFQAAAPPHGLLAGLLRGVQCGAGLGGVRGDAARRPQRPVRRRPLQLHLPHQSPALHPPFSPPTAGRRTQRCSPKRMKDERNPNVHSSAFVVMSPFSWNIVNE